MSIIEAPSREHDEEFARIVENFGEEEPRDDEEYCGACHTKRTRPCRCGSKIHNEMHSILVESCFVCNGDNWRPAPIR
jgi:hypothetical protein